MSDEAHAEPGCMDGGEHSLRAEFVGGPVDGVRGFVMVGLDRIVQFVRGVAHVYEFDPVTTEDGDAWIYRYRGADAWVRNPGEEGREQPEKCDGHRPPLQEGGAA